MELICYELSPERVELRPAPRRREWMDGTPAYHCLPLVMGNLHAWEMLCPFSFTAVWRGGPLLADVELDIDPGDARARPRMVASHFGHGILSFNPSLIMRTPPGYNLWVTGPTNSFKDGIQPMSALIETDWMPFVFSMNWKITRPDHVIRFEKGEPFCAFFPIARGVLARCDPRIAPAAEEPALLESFQWGNARRELDNLLAERDRDVYQRWYVNGELPNKSAGRAPDDHETTLVLKPFRR